LILIKAKHIQMEITKNNKNLETFSMLYSTKILIGTIITFFLLVISSFCDWFSFNDDYSGYPISATGWDGYVSLYSVRIQNWFVSINLFLYTLVLILKNTKVWDVRLIWLSPIILITILHIIFTICLYLLAESMEFEPGYYLLGICLIVLITLSLKLGKIAGTQK